jgi:hypothetical protein
MERYVSGGWDEDVADAQPARVEIAVDGLHSMKCFAVKPAPGPAGLGRSKSDKAKTLGRGTIGASFFLLTLKGTFLKPLAQEDEDVLSVTVQHTRSSEREVPSVNV